jgi:hypothetical protein
MSQQVEIKMPISKLTISKVNWDDKESRIVANFSVTCTVHPGETSRIENLMKITKDMYIIIGTSQAEFDMEFKRVDFPKPIEAIITGNTPKTTAPPLDLSTFSLTVGQDKEPHTAKLLDQEIRNPLIKEAILLVFAANGVDCQRADQLVTILKGYPESENRDRIIEILSNEETEKEPVKVKRTRKPKGE